jgi:hypothetical protein
VSLFIVSIAWHLVSHFAKRVVVSTENLCHSFFQNARCISFRVPFYSEGLINIICHQDLKCVFYYVSYMNCNASVCREIDYNVCRERLQCL